MDCLLLLELCVCVELALTTNLAAEWLRLHFES